jgi:oxygen-dependent protoporphyrinogen oxidase
MLAARRKMAKVLQGPSRPLFTSLKNGMQQMVDAVVSRLPASALSAGSPVQSLLAQDGGWTVAAGYNSDHFDAVIVAVPARAAASLVRGALPALADELAGINYSSSVTVTLGFDHDTRGSLPRGFGFLVPRSEGKRMLACTFVHNKFPHRAPEDRALVRCFLGGSRDEDVLRLSDEEILGIVRRELREIIGLSAEPLFARVCKWKGAMAQYEVGHLDRLQRIERLRSQAPGLFLAGNGFKGIGVPDCVRSGADAANAALAALGLAASQRPTPQAV